MTDSGIFPKNDGDIYFAEDANMSYFNAELSTNANFGKTIVSDSPTLIVGASPSRKKIILKNIGAEVVYIGEFDVDTTGIYVPQGYCIILKSRTSIYGITSSGSSDIRFIEVR